jgi:hypothetical protein
MANFEKELFVAEDDDAFFTLESAENSDVEVDGCEVAKYELVGVGKITTKSTFIPKKGK